jgi:hypothetical protein
MFNKTLVSLILTSLILLSIVSITASVDAKSRIGPPEIKASAPTSIQLQEDQSNYYLDFYEIFNDTGDDLTFTIWTGSAWGSSFDNVNITISVKVNDTLEFSPKTDAFGTDAITVNATNPNPESNHHIMTVSILPVNDLPVIESIGNLQVKNLNSISLYAEQNHWFNETVMASDADGDNLVFMDNTSLFDIDYQSGEISFKPGDKDVGYHFINLTVSDINGTNSEDWINVKLTILNVNDPPTAIIISPENGSTIEYYSVYFEGEGSDPDIIHGDQLSFEWSSDLDGVFSKNEFAYPYILSPGKHNITFKVTDLKGLYDEVTIVVTIEEYYEPSYVSIELELEDNYYFMKKNESITTKAYIESYGSGDINVTLESRTNFNFSGECKLDVNNLILSSYDSESITFTINCTPDQPPGIYPVDIYVDAISTDVDESNPKDNEDKYMYTDYDMDTIFLIIEDDSNINNKQAEKPIWEKGFKWNYTINLPEEILETASADGTISMEITDDTSIDVDGSDYDVYVLEENSLIDSTDDLFQDMSMYINQSITYYHHKSNLAIVKYDEQSIAQIDFDGMEIELESESEVTYEPPYDNYEFPIIPGEKWKAKTTCTDDYEYRYSGEFSDIERDIDIIDEIHSFVCIGIETVTVPAGTFEVYAILEYDSEYDDIGRRRNSRSIFTDSIEMSEMSIDYYSPKTRSIVKSMVFSQMYNDEAEDWKDENYWTKATSAELISYDLLETVPVNDTEPDKDPKNNSDDDNDENGLPDDWEDLYDIKDPEGDNDNDGFSNLDEYLNGTNPLNSKDTPENPIDTDNDGLPDAWEQFHNLDPLNPGDALEDTDNDGFSNLEEYDSGTFPRNEFDHPVIKDDDQQNDDSSVFGLGKVGNVDAAYLIIVILIMIIMILLYVMVIQRKRHNRYRGQFNLADGAETRVPEPGSQVLPQSKQNGILYQPVPPQHQPPGEVSSVPTYVPASNSGVSPQHNRPFPPPPPPTYDGPKNKTEYYVPSSDATSQQPSAQYTPPPPPPSTQPPPPSNMDSKRKNQYFR